MIKREFNGIVPDTDRALFIADNAVLIGDVVLEEGVTIWYGAVLRGDTGHIHIGKNSNIQDGCLLHCDEHGSISIGENVTVGHGAVIHGCTVEDNSLIGMGSIVLNDAVIRTGSLVGAGALIPERKNYPEYALILGSPAKSIKPVSEEQKEMIRAAAEEYISLGKIYSKDRPRSDDQKK